MLPFNSWDVERVIQKENITEFEFLCSREYITEIEDDYFYLNTPLAVVEKEFYEQGNRALMEALGIKDLEQELKMLIKKFNRYNEIKDIAQELIGKVADMRGVSITEVHRELGVLLGE